MSDSHSKKGPRWWPAALIVVLAGGVTLWLRASAGGSFQARNLRTLSVWLVAFLLLGVWWLAASRTPWRVRLGVAAALAGLVGLTATLFRIRGVSGDLVPILEPRWTCSVPLSPANESGAPAPGKLIAPGLDFPQFLGPNRTASSMPPALERDWRARPPQVLWRHPIGAAWSGCAIVGARALTQEQRPQGESSTCYDVLTGRLLWSHSEPAHYHTTLGGDGPRCTPTVVSNRVFTLGATGILNCLDLATGQRLWSRNIVEEAASRVPEWGFAGSPLAVDGMVVVSAGGSPIARCLPIARTPGNSPGLEAAGLSVMGPRFSPLWPAAARYWPSTPAGSPRTTPLTAGSSGNTLGGVGEPQAAAPVVVGANRVLFSSGYGVGSQLLELQPAADGSLSVSRLWESKKMRAKFANLVQREGFLYGLDDGVLACLDLKDGSQRWEEGRYGHGQGLLVRGLFLLMAENGELVLLQPTPQSPNELARFRVFHGKTWNPIALSGDLLLARTDQEAACLRLPLEPAAQVPTR